MFRSLVLVMALVSLIAFVRPAFADTYYTQRADAIGGAVTPGGTPTILNVNRISIAGGISYNNNFTSAAAGLPLDMGGNPTGWSIRTVTAGVLGTFSQNPGGTPLGVFSDGTGGSFNVVAVFAGQADVSIAGGFATATFTQGRIGLYAIPNGDFSATNPTSWGVGATVAGSAFAIFDLASPADVEPGPAGSFGEAVGAGAGIMNQVSLNTIDLDNSQGRVLFDDVTDPFLPIPAAVVGALETILNEGLYITISQDLFTGAISQAALDELNRIAGLYGLSDLGTNEFFATGFGTDPTDFNQVLNQNAIGSGDLVQVTLGDIYPVVQAEPQFNEVPEPASLIVWGGLTLIGAGYGAMRRRRAKA